MRATSFWRHEASKARDCYTLTERRPWWGQGASSETGSSKATSLEQQ